MELLQRWGWGALRSPFRVCARKEGDVIVACSTLCFGKQPLDEALKAIGDMHFGKVDLAIHEKCHHLRPSSVAANVGRIAHHLKSVCPLGLAAFHVEIIANDDAEHDQQLRAICRLARLVTVPLVCVPAPPAGADLKKVIERLTAMAKIAHGEGVILTIETGIGTMTEMPETAAEICEKVPGLGLTLDPSHYLVGPARGMPFDCVYPYVKHVRLRDTGAGPNEFQVRVGQGQVDYGKIVGQLEKCHYDRLLTVDVRDMPEASYAVEPEVRKLKYLLESLV